MTTPAARQEREIAPEPAWERIRLDTVDLPWITAYMDGDKFAAEAALPELQMLARVGSIPLDAIADPAARDTAFAAREDFLFRLGIPRSMLEQMKQHSPKRAYLGNTATFIESQRYLYDLGINLHQLFIKVLPWPHSSLINRSQGKWQELVEALQAAGLRTSEIRENPTVLYLSLRALRTRGGVAEDSPFADLRARHIKQDARMLLLSDEEIETRRTQLIALGFPPGVIKRSHWFLVNSWDRITDTLEVLTSAGINGPPFLTKHPEIMKFKPSTLASKIDVIKNLGIDVPRALSRHPGLLDTANGTLLNRHRFLKRAARLLRWEGDLNQLESEVPLLLQLSKERLLTSLYILAKGADASRRQMSPNKVLQYAILPVEAYMIAQSDPAFLNQSDSVDILTIGRRYDDLPLEERRARAKQLVELYPERYGRLGKLYMRYADSMAT